MYTLYVLPYSVQCIWYSVELDRYEPDAGYLNLNYYDNSEKENPSFRTGRVHLD